MKNLTILLFLILLTSCGDNSQRTAKVYSSGVIYNEDNRIDTFALKGGFWEEKAYLSEVIEIITGPTKTNVTASIPLNGIVKIETAG